LAGDELGGGGFGNQHGGLLLEWQEFMRGGWVGDVMAATGERETAGTV
jgi:hypothetical protein